MQNLLTTSALLLLAAANVCSAASLFDDQALLEVELRGPISELLDNKKEREERPFEIIVGDVSLPVLVRNRGSSRMRVCDFPPLRLNFAVAPPPDSVFEHQQRLKLVSHCTDKRSDADNVLNEYLAYRTFSLLSGESFRVRPLRIRYVDADGPTLQKYAFLIEAKDSLSERLQLTEMKTPGVVLSRLDDKQAAMIFVFQYFIGNTDWSLVTALNDKHCCHNIELFESDGRVVPVPYDFDLAGLVHASYAKPDPSLRLRSVRSRAYRGYCIDSQPLRQALRTITQQQSAIMKLAAEVPASTDKALQERLAYLSDFFTEAADESKLLRNFERRCLD